MVVVLSLEPIQVSPIRIKAFFMMGIQHFDRVIGMDSSS